MSDRYADLEWVGRNPIAKTGASHAATVPDRRETERVPFHADISYAREEDASSSRVQGRLMNLSKKGCRILGSVHCETDSRVTLWLDLHDGQAALCLRGATVCWSDDTAFGVKFPQLTDEERRRLQALILKWVTLDDSDTHAAFRLT